MITLYSKIISSVTLLSLLAASCGQKTSSSKASPPSAQEEDLPVVEEEEEEGTETPAGPADGSNISGYYLATFSTLNPHVNGTLPGSATFYRKEDRLFAYLRLFASAPKAWHQQKVYTGTRCPTLADDANTDGYIDIVEAETVVGKVLIPLDADLSTQNSGRNFYPVGDLSGSYHYERVVNFNRFLQDLRSEDKNTEDNIIKLSTQEPFLIEGKVVMIQGTAETIEYPETVASTNRHRPFQTLPIACGVFKKADITPGLPDNGTIPGPIADVMEGQDLPAGEEGDTTSNGNGNTNGGTNEAETETETRDEHGNRTRGGNDTTGRSENEGNTGGTTGVDNSHRTGTTTDPSTVRTGESDSTRDSDTDHENGPLF